MLYAWHPSGKNYGERCKVVKPLRVSFLTNLLAALLLVTSPCLAANSANLLVTATVLHYVSVNAAQHVTTYRVRSEDLKRGYIDLPNSLTVTVRTNVNGEVPVIVDSWGSGRILVKESGTGSFSGNSFTLNTAGHWSGAMISKNLDSRIVLPSDAQEGVYPLTVSMTPAI
jgi:hypothetical protein